jgi:carbonic anhydrase
MKVKLINLIIATMFAFTLVWSSTEGGGVSPQQAVAKLEQGNKDYVSGKKSSADISKQRRENTASKGQTPYAVVLTCSDSRVPPEHIFSAGVGDLFVIRTAGNVVGDFELGSIEYGVEHLGAKVIVVMGHSKCGAVAAAMSDGHIEGKVANIVEEIKPSIANAADAAKAEELNVANSSEKILQSEILSKMVKSNKVVLKQAKYDITTGKVEFLK